MSGLDTSNAFSVRRQGEDVLFDLPPDWFSSRAVLTRDKALNLAAWLALLADPEGFEFIRVYNEIKKPS